MNDFVPFDPKKVELIRRILSVAETGSPDWDPSDVYVYNDGTGGRKQCTLSIGFTADGGNLRTVLERYVTSGGVFSTQFAPWITALKTGNPGTDSKFLALLRQAGKEDPIFYSVQKSSFDDLYLGPAFAWARSEKFAEPLSFLVIADSFLHSGSIRSDIRSKFPEKTPANGGDEKKWTTQYTNARRDWLANHSRIILHNTVYRPDCFLAEIKRNNWSLEVTPIVMNDTKVFYI